MGRSEGALMEGTRLLCSAVISSMINQSGRGKGAGVTGLTEEASWKAPLSLSGNKTGSTVLFLFFLPYGKRLMTVRNSQVTVTRARERERECTVQ